MTASATLTDDPPAGASAPSAPARHLLSVWNPAYAVDAMDAHVSVLVDQARRHRAGEAGVSEDHVYVWWGRVRSERREGALPHLVDVLALD
ncbi:MAG: hypothetical protein ACF8LL_03270, partial [Phycisphaerales bacterium]